MNERLELMLAYIGASKSELARALHVTPGAVTQWLSGRTTPSGALLGLMEEKFGVSAEWLSSGKGGMILTGGKAKRWRMLSAIAELDTENLTALANIAKKMK